MNEALNISERKKSLKKGTNNILIIGAGPAGLASAFELQKSGYQVTILEFRDAVGGLARTEEFKGFRFDIGGHRYFTKQPEISILWNQVLGKDFIQVPRISHILFNDLYLSYPIEPFSILKNIPLKESIYSIFSYLKAQIYQKKSSNDFESFMIQRFGRRLFQIFFKTYTEKVWGCPCTELHADWASQRIQGLSLINLLLSSKKNKKNKTLIKHFDYPRLGSGMMWKKFQEQIENQGGLFHFNTELKELHIENNKIISIVVRKNSEEMKFSAEKIVSSIPLSDLILRIKPLPPIEVVTAAKALKYRAFILVGIVINKKSQFNDQWIYIHDTNVKVGRIQIFNNWSSDLVPDLNKTSIGMEYFCNENDNFWSLNDNEIIELAKVELEILKMADESEILESIVIKEPKAYPVYDLEYKTNVKVIENYMRIITNLQTIGRNGLHKYNNMDHSMISGLYAARNVNNQNHNLWEINMDSAYLESNAN